MACLLHFYPAAHRLSDFCDRLAPLPLEISQPAPPHRHRHPHFALAHHIRAIADSSNKTTAHRKLFRKNVERTYHRV